MPAGGCGAVDGSERKLALCVAGIGGYGEALIDVAFRGELLPVQAVGKGDGLVDCQGVHCVGACVVVRCNFDLDGGVRGNVDDLDGGVGGKTSQVGVGAVHGGRECCTGVVERADFDEGDLGRQRWIDIQLWASRSDSKESKWNHLISSSMAREEGEGRLGVAVGVGVIVDLLRELIPWRSKIWFEPILSVGVC